MMLPSSTLPGNNQLRDHDSTPESVSRSLLPLVTATGATTSSPGHGPSSSKIGRPVARTVVRVLRPVQSPLTVAERDEHAHDRPDDEGAQLDIGRFSIRRLSGSQRPLVRRRRTVPPPAPSPGSQCGGLAGVGRGRRGPVFTAVGSTAMVIRFRRGALTAFPTMPDPILSDHVTYPLQVRSKLLQGRPYVGYSDRRTKNSYERHRSLLLSSFTPRKARTATTTG